MVDSTIRGKLCQSIVFVFFFCSCINFQATFASGSAPVLCDATSEATLDGVKIEIFANLTAKITIIVTNTSFLVNASLSLKTDFSNPIDPASTEEFPDDLVVIVFDDLALGSYYLKVEDFSNDTEQFFTCALDAVKTENATCSDEALSEFSVSWNESSLFRQWNIELTDPQINSTSNQSNSFTFSGLDAGQEYNVHFVRSSTTDDVENLIYEELICITLTACNFTNNYYIEELSLKNRSSHEIEMSVIFKDSCDACKWKINDHLFDDETGVHIINTSTSHGNSKMQVINSSSYVSPLISCDITDSATTWNDPTFVCSVQTETTFSAKVTYDASIENPSAVLTNGQNMNAAIEEDSISKVLNVSWQSLVPGSGYAFIVTHERNNNGIQYKDESSCETTAMIPPKNFNLNKIDENSVTVTWNYTLGEAKIFKITVTCVSTPHCEDNEVTVNRTTGTSSFTENIQGFSPSNTYSITVSAVISTNTANSDTLTIHTKPSDVIFDDNTKCETSPTTIKLTWTQPEYNHTGIKYRIMSTTSPQSNETIAAITESLFTNLDPQTSYKFNVSAVWQTAEGDSISTSCETIAIPQPSNLNTTLIDSTTVQLRWNPVDTLPETIKYKVSCNEGSDCPPNFPYEESERTVVNVTNLIPGKVYSVSVRSSIGTFLSAGVSTEIRTRPPDCNVNEELLLQSITVNIFEESVSNISIKVDNETGS